MKVNLVSFLDPTVYDGGGEMISRQLIETGLNRGHEIYISSVRPSKINFNKDAQLTILIDVFNHGHTFKSFGAWRGFSGDFINQVIKNIPFVHITNAYADVCNLPYLPCTGFHDGEDCIDKKNLGLLKKFLIRDINHQCFSQKELVSTLNTTSILNVFLSPLHQEISERLINSNKLPESYILSPTIDTSRFYNMHKDRDIDYLFVGIVSEAKGFFEMRNRFANSNIHIIGKCAPGINIDFGNYLGPVPYDQVPIYMNRAKNFVFLPRWPEPQGRVVAEAALCGCNIIGNENVGALSFGADLTDPSYYKGVEDAFWKKVESLI